MNRLPFENQSEATRLERMADAYKLLQPSEQDIATKRMQALPRALGRRAPARAFALGLAAAAIAGSAFAVGGFLLLEERTSTAGQGAPAPASLVAPQKASASPRSKPSQLEVSEPRVAPRDAPGAGDERQVSARRDSAKSGVTERVEAPAQTAAKVDSARWSRAAEALRANDTTRAREALGELSASSDPKTRDAADLARAQLDVAEGRGASAERVFERIASQGATEQLRAQAERALRKSQGK